MRGKFLKKERNTKRGNENTSKKVSQPGAEPIDRKRGKTVRCRGRRKGGNQREKRRFIDQPETEGEKGRGGAGDECSQGNRSAKERGMDE